jgi:hypothetical protein
VVREGVGQRGEMTQALYAHMNNKTIKKKKMENGKYTNISWKRIAKNRRPW